MKKSFYEKSIIGLVFCCSVAFQSILSHAIFPADVFFKYEIASQLYLEESLDRERLLDVSPLYFALHVAARKYLPNPRGIIRYVQIGIGGISTIFLLFILRKFFSWPVALAGTLIFILNRSLMVYTSIFEPEPLMICFLLGFLFFALDQRDAMIFFSGLCVALSILTRSNFLPLAFLTPIFFWFHAKQKRRFFHQLLLFELPIILAMTILTVRNTSLAGTFTIFSMNPGYVFFEGNNPNSHGESAVYPPLIDDLVGDFDSLQPDFQHVIYRVVARRLEGDALSIPDINAYWAEKAWNFMIDHPFYTLKQFLEKVHFFFHTYRRHDLALAYQYDQLLQQTHIPTVSYALIAGLSIIGMLLAIQQWKRYLLFCSVFFVQFGVMLFTYISDRQRVVLLGVMIVFACHALSILLQKKASAMMILGGVLILFLTFYIPTDVMRDDRYAWARYAASQRAMTAARQARAADKIADASRHNAYAVAFAPGLAERRRLARLSFLPTSIEEQALNIAGTFQEPGFSAQFDLVLLLIDAGRLEDAERILNDLIAGNYRLNRQFYHSSQPYFYLAYISELRQDLQQARIFLHHALEKNPGDPWVLSHLSVLTNESSYSTALFRYFDALDAEFFLGKAYFETGQFQQAVTRLSGVIAKIPEYRRGQIYLCLALAQTGNYEEAVKQYLSAIRQQCEPIFAEQQVIRMFREWSRRSPQNPEALYYLGIILQDFGHYAEALSLQKTLLRQESMLDAPYIEHIKDNIRWLEKALSAR